MGSVMLCLFVLLVLLTKALSFQQSSSSGAQYSPSPPEQQQQQQQQQQQKVLFALLIDAQNSKASTIRPIIREIVACGGDVTVRRMFGDFTQTRDTTEEWREVAMTLAVTQINAMQYVSGKDNASAALMMHAMEILFTNPSIGGFALVSSDSDFTRLAQRLREAGKRVIGFGKRQTPFVYACERFVYTENLKPNRNRKRHLLKPNTFALIHRAIRNGAQQDGWIDVGTLEDAIVALESDFDVRTYGFGRLKSMLESFPNQFRVVMRGSFVYVSAKQEDTTNPINNIPLDTAP